MTELSVCDGGHGALCGWRAAFRWVGYPGLFLALRLFLLREPRRGASAPPTTASLAPARKGWRTYADRLKFPRDVLVVAG